MESVWSVSKLSTESVGSRRELCSHRRRRRDKTVSSRRRCVHTADARRRRCVLGFTVSAQLYLTLYLPTLKAPYGYLPYLIFRVSSCKLPSTKNLMRVPVYNHKLLPVWVYTACRVLVGMVHPKTESLVNTVTHLSKK